MTAMPNELINQGLNLLVLGMGVVFIFLALLIVATSIMSKIVQSYFPEPLPAVADTSQGSDSPVPSDTVPVDATVLAAIKAAVQQHRNR